MSIMTLEVNKIQKLSNQFVAFYRKSRLYPLLGKRITITDGEHTFNGLLIKIDWQDTHIIDTAA